MKSDEEKYTLIEQYLGGELTGEALKEFEQKLRDEPEWQRDVDLHRELGDFLGDKKGLELRAALKEVGSKPRSGKQRTLLIRYIPIAATFALLITVTILLLNKSETLDPQQLFAQNFTPYEMVLNPRSVAINPKEELRNSAINAYESANYREAIVLFNQLETSNSLGMAPVFYKGICYLALGDTRQAIDVFEELLKSGNSLFTEQTNWYLGLAYLQSNEKAKALSQFQSISQSGGYKADAARKILDKLNQD